MVDKDKRRFLTRTLPVAMATAVGSTIGSIEKTHAADFSSISALSSLLMVDPITLQYMVFGSCCWYCASNLIVSHYQPVYFIEVLRSATDNTIFGSVSSVPSKSTSTIVQSNGYHAFEVRIWEIPDWVIDVAMGFQSCKLCGPRYAPKHTKENSFNLCSSGALLAQALTVVNDAMPDCIPTLVYDSTLDSVAWKTGCNDALKSGTYTSPLVCATTAGYTKEQCLGKWGSKYPRQMAKTDNNPRRAAVVAALRALSHAADMGMTNYSGDTRIGKIQQVFPQARPGFPVGTSPADKAMASVKVPYNSVFGYVWWLPTICCKNYSQIYGFCTPKIPCAS